MPPHPFLIPAQVGIAAGRSMGMAKNTVWGKVRIAPIMPNAAAF